MELEVLKITGESTGRKVQLNENIYGIEPNDHCIYLDTKQYLADQRQGTHKAKTRSEISGSTRKLFRQKGTGGARRGDINSPVLRPCLVTFFSKKSSVYESAVHVFGIAPFNNFFRIVICNWTYGYFVSHYL